MNANALLGIGLVLILIGSGVGVVGASFFTSTAGECQTYTLLIDKNPGGYDTAPYVTYEELSSEQQEVFRNALQTEPERSGSYSMGVPDAYFAEPTRITYQNETYLATILSNDGCMPLVHHTIRGLPVALGLIMGLGGFAVARRGYQARETES